MRPSVVMSTALSAYGARWKAKITLGQLKNVGPFRPRNFKNSSVISNIVVTTKLDASLVLPVLIAEKVSDHYYKFHFHFH